LYLQQFVLMAIDPIREIADECLAVRVRMLARAVSAIYDRALSEHGLTVAQLNILVFLGRSGSSGPGVIGRALRLERSTVSRNLERMIAQEWIAAATDAGGRAREVWLTAKGRKKLISCLDAWRVAQEQTASLLGTEGVQAVHSLGRRLWKRSGVRLGG
jgi:DNA-binding MarR family transcriptional regulator